MPPENSSEDGLKPQSPRPFVTTSWSLVLAAGNAESTESTDALEKLCSLYWFPIYAEIRRRGYVAHDAQDLTQEFFYRLLARRDFAVAKPELGRFRCYLLGALKHFLSDEWDRSKAIKRGGRAITISIDAVDPEARYELEAMGGDGSPEREFDRRWAASLLDQCLRQLREEYARLGKEGLFETVKGYLSSQPAQGDYERAGKLMGMSSGAVAVAVHRIRQRYGEIVREQIAETLGSQDGIESELQILFASLG